MGGERELLRRCAQGDSGAWEEFLRRHGGTVHAMARYTLRRVLGKVNDADAENIVQGVFVRLLENGGRKLLSYQGRSDLSVWLRTVTSRFALNYIRSEKSGGSLRFRPLEDQAEESISEAELSPVLGLLKPGERAALVMHFQDGMTYEEIAGALGLPVNTVASHIHRARKKLKK